MSSKIYVGNLSYSTNNSALEAAFSAYGTVESAKVIVDRDTDRSKGFAFIEMSSPSEAQDAIAALHESDLGGRQINVSLAKPMAPRQNRY
jgi:RNA recognition motif-containing protein